VKVERTVPPVERGTTRVLVPTMGALHDGHRSLMRAARVQAGESGEVVVSVFVNPTQFAAGEDFDAYPRTLHDDELVCQAEGVDLLYAPTVSDIYGTDNRGDRIRVDPGPLGRELEGGSRPTHFTGVLTVVSILFHRVRPDVAIFGEKDYQQLQLIRRMNDDLGFGIRIVGVETVRDVDGLALSSRNSYLSSQARHRAASIPAAMDAAQSAAREGADAAKAAAEGVLRDGGMEIDYVEVRSADLGESPEQGAARLLIACTVEGTRLIDNCLINVGEGR